MLEPEALLHYSCQVHAAIVAHVSLIARVAMSRLVNLKAQRAVVAWLVLEPPVKLAMCIELASGAHHSVS